jgi:hypothetical protein
MEDIDKYQNQGGDSLADHCMYVEQWIHHWSCRIRLDIHMMLWKFTGQFMKRKAFPKGYRSIEMPDKAKIFRYTHYEIVQSNYGETITPDFKLLIDIQNGLQHGLYAIRATD